MVIRPQSRSNNYRPTKAPAECGRTALRCRRCGPSLRRQSRVRSKMVLRWLGCGNSHAQPRSARSRTPIDCRNGVGPGHLEGDDPASRSTWIGSSTPSPTISTSSTHATSSSHGPVGPLRGLPSDSDVIPAVFGEASPCAPELYLLPRQGRCTRRATRPSNTIRTRLLGTNGVPLLSIAVLRLRKLSPRRGTACISCHSRRSSGCSLRVHPDW